MGVVIERAAGLDEHAGVGDRVAHAVPLLERLDVQRLIEVERARRIDRHERHVDPLALERATGGGLRLGLHLRRKPLGDPGLAPHRLETRAHRGRGIDPNAARGHRQKLAPSL